MYLVKRLLRKIGTKYVVKMSCKLCTKYKSETLKELKGSAKTAALAFLDRKKM